MTAEGHDGEADGSIVAAAAAAAPARSDAERLFADAVELVRSYALQAPSYAPDFASSAPRLAVEPARGTAPGDGPVLGLPGDLWATAEDLRAGRDTVADLAERSVDRIARYGERFHTFEHLADPRAASEPLDRAAREGRWQGPLHGIPLSIKDIIDVAGMPTTGSSRALPPCVAAADATAVARLRAAGALFTGKAVTHEFTLGVTTEQAHNPWDEERIPGGSSGGSVISVVTGMALGSLGTDTRASIRVPPALSGGVGVRSSRDVVPVDAWCTLSWTMDRFGPITRSVRDAALLLDVLSGGEQFRAALPGDLCGRAVGYTDAFVEGADAGVRERFEEALGVFERGGASVVRLAGLDPDLLDLANAAGMLLSRAEAAQYHAQAGTVLDRCTVEVRDQLTAANGMLATDYLHALQIRGAVNARLLESMAEVDVLVMPTTRVVAPPHEEAGRYLLRLSENCIPWSLGEFCAVSAFMGMRDGLPTGLQLVGRPGADADVLAIAHGFEQAGPRLPEWSAPEWSAP